MGFVWTIALVVLLVAFLLATLIGMPGNWLIVLLAALYAYALPHELRAWMSWNVVAALFVLAVIGEVVEFAAAGAGVRRAGGSRRGAAMALGGSIVGGIAGLFVGLPIPIIGSLAGALLCGSVGALIGAVLGEAGAGAPPEGRWRIGRAAFWGRLWGTLGKFAVGVAMALVAIVAAIVK